jgi:hypothetical protein
VIGVTLVSAFNYLIDPYGIYRQVCFNFNAQKPYASTQIRMVKAYGAKNIRPRSLSLGNSRVDIGLDPLCTAWPEDGKPNYNLGIPGGDLYTSLKYLEYAFNFSEVRYVVMGLDFMDFPASPAYQSRKNNEMEEFEKRLCSETLCTDNFIYINQRVKDIITSIGSLSATIDSVRTVFNQGSADTTPMGFNPLKEYDDYVHKEGHYSLFLQRDIENARNYIKKSKNLFVNGTNSSPNFDNLKKIIRLCRQKNVHLYFYIHPYHARLNETIKAAGFWSLFEEWKRQIVKIVDEESKEKGWHADLWDFSGYNSITTEQVPTRGDTKTKMKWYWEAGHYKKETGDLVLHRIFNNFKLTKDLSDFGILLDSKSLERHLNVIRVDQENYLAQNLETVYEIKELVRNVPNRNSIQEHTLKNKQL